MVYRLGAGANAASGGSFAVGESSTVRFRVTIDPATQHNAIITSQATMTFIGVTLGGSLSRVSNQTNTPLSPVNDPPVNVVPAAARSTAGRHRARVFLRRVATRSRSATSTSNAAGTGTIRVTLTATGGVLTLPGTVA